MKTAVRVGMGVALLGSALLLAPGSLAGAATSPPSASPLIPAPAPTPGSGAGQSGAQSSTNWAGYAVTGAAFSSVSGSWGQPSATCATHKAALAAFWIGLDGYGASDPTVEQIGTDSDCAKGKGKASGGPTYYAWFEMYPAPPVVLSQRFYPVAPGDASAPRSRSTGPAISSNCTTPDGGRTPVSRTVDPSTRRLGRMDCRGSEHVPGLLQGGTTGRLRGDRLQWGPGRRVPQSRPYPTAGSA